MTQNLGIIEQLQRIRESKSTAELKERLYACRMYTNAGQAIDKLNANPMLRQRVFDFAQRVRQRLGVSPSVRPNEMRLDYSCS